MTASSKHKPDDRAGIRGALSTVAATAPRGDGRTCPVASRTWRGPSSRFRSTWTAASGRTSGTWTAIATSISGPATAPCCWGTPTRRWVRGDSRAGGQRHPRRRQHAPRNRVGAADHGHGALRRVGEIHQLRHRGHPAGAARRSGGDRQEQGHQVSRGHFHGWHDYVACGCRGALRRAAVGRHPGGPCRTPSSWVAVQ